MTYMLSRNRVEDFDRWKRVFDAHAEAHRAAGLRLVHLWKTVSDPNDFFFLMAVEDIARAQAFIDAPESARAGEEAGVLAGNYHFIESA